MKDGNSHGEENGGLDRLGQDLPEPKPQGLFRAKPPVPVPGGGRATLRVVGQSGKNGSATDSADDWAALPLCPVGPVAAGAAVEDSFDMLRTRLAGILAENGWSRVAVAAPTRGCGASFTAAHLALSFARIPDSRTVLMDLNQRRPSLGTLLKVRGRGDMRGFLTGRTHLRDHLVRAADTLALGLTQTPGDGTEALLQSDTAALVLGDLMDRLLPDLLICDLPPVLEHDDLLAFLPQVDGVLLVADASQTTPAHIAACERQLEGRTRVLGVALNQARLSGPAPAFA